MPVSPPPPLPPPPGACITARTIQFTNDTAVLNATAADGTTPHFTSRAIVFGVGTVLNAVNFSSLTFTLANASGSSTGSVYLWNSPDWFPSTQSAYSWALVAQTATLGSGPVTLACSVQLPSSKSSYFYVYADGGARILGGLPASPVSSDGSLSSQFGFSPLTPTANASTQNLTVPSGTTVGQFPMVTVAYDIAHCWTAPPVASPPPSMPPPKTYPFFSEHTLAHNKLVDGVLGGVLILVVGLIAYSIYNRRRAFSGSRENGGSGAWRAGSMRQLML